MRHADSVFRIELWRAETEQAVLEHEAAGRAAGAAVIAAGGSIEEATYTAQHATRAAGGSTSTSAKTAGEVAGASIIASSGSVKEAGKAAMEASRMHGGSSKVQLNAAANAVSIGSGSSEDAVAAVIEAGIRSGASSNEIQTVARRAKQAGLQDGGIGAAIRARQTGTLKAVSIESSAADAAVVQQLHECQSALKTKNLEALRLKQELRSETKTLQEARSQVESTQASLLAVQRKHELARAELQQKERELMNLLGEGTPAVGAAAGSEAEADRDSTQPTAIGSGLEDDVRELKNNVRRVAGSVSTSELQAERDYLLASLEEFETKVVLTQTHVGQILAALSEAHQDKLHAEQALAEATRDKLQAIEMAEMLVRQRLCETEVALSVVNHRQVNPMAEGLIPAHTLLRPPGRAPPPPYGRNASPVPLHSPPY